MKKLMYIILIVTLFVSCSNLNSSLENSFTKEIGKKPTKNELKSNAKTQVILWENVDLEKRSILKNTIDRIFGSLPIETSDLSPELDSNYNEIEGAYHQYQIYESTKSKVELSFRYFKSKPDLMDVQLYLTTK